MFSFKFITKCLLVVINIVFMVTVVTLIGLTANYDSAIKRNEEESLLDAKNIQSNTDKTIITLVVLFFILAFGCWGSITEKKPILIVHALIMLFVAGICQYVIFICNSLKKELNELYPIEFLNLLKTAIETTIIVYYIIFGLSLMALLLDIVMLSLLSCFVTVNDPQFDPRSGYQSEYRNTNLQMTAGTPQPVHSV